MCQSAPSPSNIGKHAYQISSRRWQGIVNKMRMNFTSTLLINCMGLMTSMSMSTTSRANVFSTGPSTANYEAQ